MSNARLAAMGAIKNQIAIATPQQPGPAQTPGGQTLGQLPGFGQQRQGKAGILTPAQKAQIGQSKVQGAQARAVSAGENAQLAGARRQAFLAQVAERTRQQGIRQAQQVANAFRGGASNVGSVIEHVPTPGGIGVPVVILLILWLVLIPVNGHSRLVWFFLVLLGQAHITGAFNEGTPIAPLPLTTSTIVPSNIPKISNTGQAPIPVSAPIPTSSKKLVSAPVPAPTKTSLTSNNIPVKKHSIADQLHHTSHSGGL